MPADSELDQAVSDRLTAARIAGSASLLDVRARSISAEMLHGEFEPPYEVRIEVAPSMKYRNDHVLYEYVYSVEALRSAEGDDGDEDADDVDEDRIVARFQTCLVLVYSLDEATKFSDEELQAFGATTGLLTAHPFARETVASLSTRVGLPQLVLDVMRVPMPPPPDVPAEASGGDV